jgi:hypothetical protein
MISDNIRSATTYDYLWYRIGDNIKLSTIIRMSTIYDQRQHTIIYKIRSATICDYLQYMISDNIQLSTVDDQRKYSIIYDIRSSTIYDYLWYMIGDNIWSSTIYDYLCYYIMILFKQFYWLSCCHLTFRKIWYCLIKTRIDLVSLSFSNEIYKKNHVHFNVIKQLQSFLSVNTSFYGP